MNKPHQIVPDKPLTALLGAAAPQVVSLVGAGGKTSLLFALAHLLVAAGERVVCTTTTRMFFPTPEQCTQALLIGDAQEQDVLKDVHTLLRERPMVFLAHSRLEQVMASAFPVDGIKLQGLPATQVTRLATALPGVRFLVEADGAARRPLKAPAAHEPVVPLDTGCCIGVIGLDCLNKPLDAAVAHRLDCVLAVTGQAKGSVITSETLRRLASHPEGLFRNCPPCRHVVFCNKAEVSACPIPVFPVQKGLCWFAGSVREGWCRPLV